MTNYKCIVTLHNGAHKIARMTKSTVACLATGFRNMQGGILTRRYGDALKAAAGLSSRQVKSFLFINEWTGERLEIA